MLTIRVVRSVRRRLETFTSPNENMYLKSVLPVLLLFLFSQLFSGNLEFFREDLDFEIKGNYFHVDGIYYFRNNSDTEIKRLLFYPFPLDSLYGIVDSMQAICLSDSSDCFIKSNEKGFSFKIKIAPNEEEKYRLSYRQKLLGNKAEYILTTTQRWGKPFEEVNYKILLPKDVKLDSLSYFPDSLKTVGDKHIFYYHKINFMPDRNMKIWFEKP